MRRTAGVADSKQLGALSSYCMEHSIRLTVLTAVGYGIDKIVGLTEHLRALFFCRKVVACLF